MEKIIWTDSVRNGEVLHRVKEERNNLHIMKRRKANWIGVDCVGTAFQNVIEGKVEGIIEVTGRR